jgi:branched-chain amino acid transport system ATP-binding protein
VGLKVTDLAVSYGRRRALDGVSLTVAPGEVLSVLGHNGAGKTTLLKGIFGLVPSSGSVSFRGKALSSRTTVDSVRKGISFTPAEAPVFREFTVRRNLELGAFSLRDSARRTERTEFVHSIFPMLAEKIDALAGELSGGQQRQLAIGIALMGDPTLLLLDEPSLGISPAVVTGILSRLRSLCDENGMSILLVEQNVRAALAISDRVCFLRSGRIILTESAEQTRAREHWWDLF